MGYHAKASLNYEYCFNKYDDDYDELPWIDSVFRDIDLWWENTILKYTPSIDIYDEHYNTKENVTPEDKRKYWKEYNKFKDKNPLPISFFYYGYENNDGIILFVNNTEHKLYEEGSKIIKSFDIDEVELEKFNHFCQTYLGDLIKDKELGWHLSASYG